MREDEQSLSGRERASRPKAEVRNSRIRGRLYKTSAGLLTFVGWLLLSYGKRGWARPEGGVAVVIVVLAVGAVLLSLAGTLFVRSRRNLAATHSSVSRVPRERGVVLYLRSFSNDEDFARAHQGSHQGLELDMVRRWTEEEEIADAVFPFGEMVSLGGPEELPYAGSTRIYASDDAWKREVLHGLERASLILLVCGTGRSLRWEVEQIHEMDCPRRLVLVVGRDIVEYSSFKEEMERFFPAGLPAYTTPVHQSEEAEHYFPRSVIWFDEDWTPHLVHLGERGKLPRGVLSPTYSSRWLAREFARAIAPVYRRAGLL